MKRTYGKKFILFLEEDYFFVADQDKVISFFCWLFWFSSSAKKNIFATFYQVRHSEKKKRKIKKTRIQHGNILPRKVVQWGAMVVGQAVEQWHYVQVSFVLLVNIYSCKICQLSIKHSKNNPKKFQFEDLFKHWCVTLAWHLEVGQHCDFNLVSNQL